MTKYIQGKDGKFDGSIGDGKNDIPTASSVPALEKIPAAEEVIADTSAVIDQLHQQFLAASNPEPVHLDDQARTEVVAALNEIGRIAEESVNSWQRTLDRLREIHEETNEKMARINLKYAHLDIEEALRAEDDRGTKFEILHTRYYEKHPTPQDTTELLAKLAEVRANQAAAGLTEDDE